MNWREEWKTLAAIVGGFLLLFFLPVEFPRFQGAVMESFHLVKWYAREHVLLCLVPAFFIAGGITVFVSQGAVMRYLGAQANRFLAYGVASVSGTILAVCSCTVLPLFSGIYRRGAGLGPAVAFLYSGPAINVLAIILTARVLGLELGIARAIGAILFSIVIGLLMHLIFRREETQRQNAILAIPEDEHRRPLWQNVAYFGAMVAILVFANWGKSDDPRSFFNLAHSYKWYLTAGFGALLALILIRWFRLSCWKIGAGAATVSISAFIFPHEPLIPFALASLALAWTTSGDPGEGGEWFSASWDYTRQILPLLVYGVLIAGFLLGRPGHEGVIPSEWVAAAVGGNSFSANLFASVAGAFMYFATLTEVPILQGLIGSGMGKGPALALLLAGPALSLPSMLVIRGVLGTRKTLVYVALVVIMATISGLIFGQL